MSLCDQDLIHIPYEESLTLAGVTCALRTLPRTWHQSSPLSPRRIRRNIVSAAVELALRRWLESKGIPYRLLDARPFTQPLRPTMILGGRQLEIHCTFITSRHLIRRVQHDPASILELEALVSNDRLAMDSMGEGDLFLFSILTGLETRTHAELRRAIHADQILHLIATPPSKSWFGRTAQQSLGKLVLKSDNTHDIEIAVVGLTYHQLQVANLMLHPHQRTVLAHELTSLHYLHPNRLPERAIGVHSPTLRRTWVVKPQAWSNVWIYGMEVILLGWCTKASFRRQGRLFPAGSLIHLDQRISIDHFGMPVSRLRPIGELVARLHQG